MQTYCTEVDPTRAGDVFPRFSYSLCSIVKLTKTRYQKKVRARN